MDLSNFNLSSDYFILDRDQNAFLNTPRAQSIPKTLYNHHENKQSLIIEDIYEMIIIGTEHITLYHESAPLSILATAQEERLQSEDLQLTTRSYQMMNL